MTDKPRRRRRSSGSAASTCSSTTPAGTIDTPMVAVMLAKGELDMAQAIRNQPIGRLGTADEIAAAVLWLCSPAASFVVGVGLPVDGGDTAA
jgi:NAD(P)-dependent dehydrogenase (short-subunit alcohol dehydrogenase family)